MEAVQIHARSTAGTKLYWEAKLAELEEEAKANFNPAQPRVPAGNSDGGQWTDTGGRVSAERQAFRDYLRGNLNGKPRLQAIEDIRRQREGGVVGTQYSGNPRRYSPILEDEEINGGHTLKRHVYPSDAEELERVRRQKFTMPGMVLYKWHGKGLFASTEAANDFVNQILRENHLEVDMVASGVKEEAFFEKRFGYPTGKEAFRSDPGTLPYMRKTYSVGVAVRHNPQRERRYTVITAYPKNQDSGED